MINTPNQPHNTQDGDILLEVEALSFLRHAHTVFKFLDIKIRRGCVTAILGPSGTGKTTLLKLMGGLLNPTTGRVLFQGQDIHRLSRGALTALRRRMGMLFQTGGLFTDLSVFENVAFCLREHTDLSDALIRDIVLMKLEAVGLRGACHLMPNALSGGMARRVALARAIALDPEFVMYDEPFTGQDPILKGILVRLIRTFNDTLGITSVVVSHDVQETFSIADYVYILADGLILAEGTPATLSMNTTLQVEQFLKGLPDGPVPFHYEAPSKSEDFLCFSGN
jgi:phospholipid/cholesterol/gamma-HCH transport system ATP-binding protein